MRLCQFLMMHIIEKEKESKLTNSLNSAVSSTMLQLFTVRNSRLSTSHL